MSAEAGTCRLVVLASHPIQYQAPLFRALSERLELQVLFAHRASRRDQARAGFGEDFEWDVDLLSGYPTGFLENVSGDPGLHHFGGCDTPSIGRRLDELSPDGILVMGWQLKSFIQGVRAARRRRIPVMVRGDSHLGTPRGLARRLLKRLIYPILLRRFDAALYVGQRSREYWRHYGYPASRLFFSPHCVDNDWFRARATPEAGRHARAGLGLDSDSIVILFAGKLISEKRPVDVIEAAACLAVPGMTVSILFVGSGPLRQTLESRARALGVNAVFAGFRNQSEMPAMYAASDLLVLSSESETWGLVANEALACGVPVVVSDACGCAPDLAADGIAGAAFETGSVSALASAIARTLEQPPDAASIRRRSEAFGISPACDGIVAGLEFAAGSVGRRST